MKNFRQSCSRIDQINWNKSQCDKPSHKILVQEFIRRGNIFRDIYDSENTKRLAVFSATKTIDETIPKDIQRIIENKNLIEHGWTIAELCEYYLEWSYLSDMNNEVAIKYSDLYEPIIKLFERGGRLSYHQNELICGKVGWPRNCYYLSREVFIEEISDKILDNIDLEYK